MKYITNILILLISIAASSCAMMEHRDFEAQMDPYQANNDPLFLPNRDFAVVPGDSGRYFRNNNEINERTPATAQMREKDLYNNSIRRELVGLENKMDDATYQEYIKVRDKLGSNSEKIYFLRLSSHEKREYLQLRRIKVPQYYTVRESRIASYSKQVIMGMGKKDVLRSLGQPDKKDYSGDPRFQNERWAYSRNGTVKYIYFEGGQVGGWTEQ